MLAGLALQALRGRERPWAEHAASVCFLGGGLAFRYAWVEAGKASALDHEAVAQMAREAPHTERLPAKDRRPLDGPVSLPVRAWTEGVRRVSLLVDGLLQRRR